MRIVHLSTYDGRGGAAQSTLGLHRGLRRLGEESVIVCQEQSEFEEGIFVHAEDGERNRRNRFLREFLVGENRSGISSTHYSLSLLPSGVARHPAVLEADIIHLHWVADFVSPVDLMELLALGKPVFWSLLDLRPFTGGCHFPGDCRKYETGCGECPQLRRDYFSQSLCEALAVVCAGSLHGIAHNRWMRDAALRSLAWRGLEVSVAPYDVNAEVFFASGKSGVRAKLGIGERRVVFLLGADDPKDVRKGIARLAQEMQARWQGVWNEAERPLLLTMGGILDLPHPFPLDVVQLGHLDGMEALREAFVASDWFLLPTLEDNSPLLLLYSLACATPVVAFATGGIPEILNAPHRGMTLPVGDWGAFLETLKRVVSEGVPSDSGAEKMLHDGSLSYQFPAHAERCMAIYERAGESFRAPGRKELEAKRDACQKLEEEIVASMCDFGEMMRERCAGLGGKLDELRGAVEFFQGECNLKAQLLGAWREALRRAGIRRRGGQ